MRVLITGASGFIGSAAARALRARGAEVIAVVHRGEGRIDLADMDEADWQNSLQGVDAVVNCAGIFADTARAKAEDVNHLGAVRLFRACATAGVRRIVHLSAIGVEKGRSAFARSKRAADEALMAMDLDWVILRPSIVWGGEAAGGSALLRGLAGLPVLPIERGVGDLQIVQLDDVAETIARLAGPDAPVRIVLELVGPERLSFADTIGAIRDWLGEKRAVVARVPGWLMGIGYALGDLVGWLGWKTPIRSSARAELRRGATGDPAAWIAATDVKPKGFREALSAKPASAQERSYAAMYFLQPAIIGVTSLFFIGTGITSLWHGYDIGIWLLERGGMGALSAPSVIGGGLADLLAGLLIAWRPTVRWGLYLAIALSFFYFVMGTVLLPDLWRDPIGPMLKIFPLIVLNFVALAMVRVR